MYNKKRLEGKQIGGGGPRDKQLVQRIRKEQELKDLILSPAMSAEVSTKPEIDLSQYLPLEEVKKKIEEAVAVTAESERKRFESGLKNLNDQLNVERKKVTAAQDQLINATTEVISEKAKQIIIAKELDISKLKAESAAKLELHNRVLDELDDHKNSLVEYKSKLDVMVEIDTNNKVRIAELETSLKEKEESSLKSSVDLNELKIKLDKLYDRISDGSIKPLVGSNMDRPSLEDRIFIDPIEKDGGQKLDSHIDIKEDKSSKTDSERDINTDLAKLRNLLKL